MLVERSALQRSLGVGLLSELHLLKYLLWKELVDWRSASWVKVGSLTWRVKSSESGIHPPNLKPEAISSPGVCPATKKTDNICPNSTRRSPPKLVASVLAFSISASIPLACLVASVAYISSGSRYGVVPGGEVA